MKRWMIKGVRGLMRNLGRLSEIGPYLRYLGLGGLVCGLFLPFQAGAQTLVDCTGTNPGAYPTISAALAANPGPAVTILITGPCHEDVHIVTQLNLYLGANWGQTASLTGSLSINNSSDVYIYGMNISNSSVDGVAVNASSGVTLDSCTSNGNAGAGLSALSSDVAVIAPAAFDRNALYGINVNGNGSVTMGGSTGNMEINNNAGDGVFVSTGLFSTLGNTTIANNSAIPNSNNLGFGVDMRGSSRAQFGALFGPNLIEGNQGGGLSLQENSEVSLWSVGPTNTVQANGPVGISANFGSQVTLYDDAVIFGHSGPALDIGSNSQAYLFGTNQIYNNGSSSDPRSAAVRLDGNSEAFIRGGKISQNHGPAILALVNSSADFTGVTFGGTSGGTITCDSSAYMVSDLSTASSANSGVNCRTPHNLGNRHWVATAPQIPDWSVYKARQDRARKAATKK
jgi:hypothetical protein